MLLKKGEAKIVTESSDILEEFSFIANKNNKKITPSLNERQKNIYDHLLQEVLFFDEILEKTSLSISELTGEISMMEMQSIIQKNREGKYEIF